MSLSRNYALLSGINEIYANKINRIELKFAPELASTSILWANSLCQGANLPMPMPLKVDKIPGGARIGFITVGDGETEVSVYIDCLVFPPTDSSGPIFRAIRNGRRKAEAPPGEPRIMRSLLGALQKSVEIARI